MELLLWGILALSLFTIFLLFIKIHLLRKSAQEISEAFALRLTQDTNTLIDISSRDAAMKQLAEQINEQLRVLRRERHRYQQGDLELKESVTNISHDLRTPLTAICAYLDLLEHEEKSEDAARYTAQIKNRAQALKALTEELFCYSVVTSPQKLRMVRTDVSAVLEESLLSFYAAMTGQGILPKITLPGEPVWRTLDGEALGRIFSNIISNALKYSDGDFLVAMTSDCAITFSNTAKSLTSVTAARLFDRFYTVETSRSSTGLGLSIAKHLTGQMGGTIDADYQDGMLHIHLKFQ